MRNDYLKNRRIFNNRLNKNNLGLDTFEQSETICTSASQEIRIPKCAFIRNEFRFKESFIANDPTCLGISNGYYWEFINPDSTNQSGCQFDREINGTHITYKTTVESKLPEAEISPLITRSRNLIMDFTCSLEV